jgi:hypothetical protein
MLKSAVIAQCTKKSGPRTLDYLNKKRLKNTADGSGVAATSPQEVVARYEMDFALLRARNAHARTRAIGARLNSDTDETFVDRARPFAQRLTHRIKLECFEHNGAAERSRPCAVASAPR